MLCPLCPFKMLGPPILSRYTPRSFCDAPGQHVVVRLDHRGGRIRTITAQPLSTNLGSTEASWIKVRCAIMHAHKRAFQLFFCVFMVFLSQYDLD